MNLDKPFRGADAVAAGLTTRRQLAGPGFRTLARDTYVAANTTLDERERIAAITLAVPDAVIGGYAAATVLGAPCAPRDAPVDLVVGRRRVRGWQGVRIRQDVLGEDEIVESGGLRVTSPLRTAFDLARELAHVEAVVAVDALAHAFGLDVDALLDYPVLRDNPRGARRLVRAVADADARSESPPETRVRLLFKGSGLVAPVPQYVVLDNYGRVVARLDFAWPTLRLALEYQGDEHRTDRRQWARDATRTASLAGVGWVVVPVTAHDLFVDPEGFLRRVRDALAARARQLGRAAA